MSTITIQRYRRTRREYRLMTERITRDTRQAARLLRDAAGALQRSKRGGYVAVYIDGVRQWEPIVLGGRLL